MALYNYSKFKILIDPNSKKLHGLKVGDVVRRQYSDSTQTIYSLMVVLSIGSDLVLNNDGKDVNSPYFVGALIEGSEPKTGELLDFVRTANLFDTDRSGALYLTASDSESPYMDVIDGTAIEKSLCYPYLGFGTDNAPSISKYACVGDQYLSSSYKKTDSDVNRLFRITRNAISNTNNDAVGFKQTLVKQVSNPQRLIFSYKIRASKAMASVPVSFGYTDETQVDGSCAIDIGTEWQYKLNIVTVDYPSQNQRSWLINLASQLTLLDEWVEIAELNIVLVSDVANFSNGTKARVGKISGIVDPVFGKLEGYGGYFQNLYATKNINIAGTLTAGDENGFASTFYVGKIHKNLIENSTECSFLNGGVLTELSNPLGIGKVYSIASGARLSIQTSSWLKSHLNEKACFSIWLKSNEAGYVSVLQNSNNLQDIQIETTGEWVRYSVPFVLSDTSDSRLLIQFDTAITSLHATSPQLEFGEKASQYQPTDGTLAYNDDYGAWFNKGGIGGTIQNPLLKLNSDGSISSKGDAFLINNDGTGQLAGGAIKWTKDKVELAETVVVSWAQIAGTEGKITSTEIANGAITTDKIAANTITAEKIQTETITSLGKIVAGSFELKDKDGNIQYEVSMEGLLTAVNANISGKITASEGSIAGWKINSTSISSGNISMGSDGAIKATVDGIDQWSLNNDGKIYAQYIEIGGGKIAGWSISSDAIFLGVKQNVVGKNTAAGGLTIGTNGIRSVGWYLDIDGSFAFGNTTGSTYIKYTQSSGNIVIGEGVKLLRKVGDVLVESTISSEINTIYGNIGTINLNFEKYVRKDVDETITGKMTFTGGIVSVAQPSYNLENLSASLVESSLSGQSANELSRGLVETSSDIGTSQSIMAAIAEVEAGVVNGMTIPVYDQLTEPTTTSGALWITPMSSGEDVIGADNPVLTAAMSRLSDILERVEDLEYKLNYGLDAGSITQSSSAEVEDGIGIDPVTGEQYEYEVPSGSGDETIYKIKPAKRCTKSELGTYNISDGEFCLVTDQTKPMLYIGYDGKAYLLGGSSDGGDNNNNLNQVMDYIDMQVAGKPTIYRVKVKEDGSLDVYDRRKDTETCAAITDAQKGLQVLRGLTISMVYAGGETSNTSSYQPCSHSFIELHNNTLSEQEVNLNGISLQYSTGGTWKAYKLSGIIPYMHSFLIRCAPCSDIEANTTVVDLTNKYDFDIPDLQISNTKFKLLLAIGSTAVATINPMSIGTDATTYSDGYIDLVGAQSPSVLTANSIDGYETYPYKSISPNRGMVRHFLAEFNKTEATTQLVGGDTNNNLTDFRPVDYTMNVDVKDTAKVYAPWSVNDGQKTVYYNKTSFNPDKPNMLSMTFGKNVNTTRCFCWISVGYYNECLQYRVRGASDWSTLGSINVTPTADNTHIAVHNRKRLRAEDGTRYTSHKVILNSLQATSGVDQYYEYRTGREGHWSDVYTFKLKYFDATTPFKFLQVTDQQGWCWQEYQPWKTTMDTIMAQKETLNGGDYDFMINTGDYTQNGNRSSEWMDYYEAAKDYLPCYPMMGCIGNNDLGPEDGSSKGKTNPVLFSSFFCHEYDSDNIPFLPKTDSWDRADAALIDKNLMRSVYSFEIANTHFCVLNGYCYVDEVGTQDSQKPWFETDMAKAKANPNIEHIVVITHDCPFSVVTNSALRRTCRLNRDDAESFPIDAIYPATDKYSWSRLFEKYNVDVVIGGHKHTYARSKPVKETVLSTGVVDPLNPSIDTASNTDSTYQVLNNPTGVVYVTCQATGYKLSSNKELPGSEANNPWAAKIFVAPTAKKASVNQYFPTFINWSFATAKFAMDTYMVHGTMTKNATSGFDEIYDMYAPPTVPITVQKIDTMTLNKS